MKDQVSEVESGQKLLNLLQRRLNLPQNLLHRWLRTGQIRLNGKRCKPFERVSSGDVIRLPPFVRSMTLEDDANAKSSAGTIDYPSLEEAGFLPLPGASSGIWAINKPSGLPVQGGTGHVDSVAGRLHRFYVARCFVPVPAHRLDKDTSGTLLIGASYAGLRLIQDNLHSGEIRKEYVAWVHGSWPWRKAVLLRHYLVRNPGNSLRAMLALDENEAGALEALCVAEPLIIEKQKSLLHILLLTGRRHQIRAQLAHMRHPILGDNRYGSAPKNSQLLLHALAARMPGFFEFQCLPPWEGQFALENMPRILCPGMTKEKILQITRLGVIQETD